MGMIPMATKAEKQLDRAAVLRRMIPRPSTLIPKELTGVILNLIQDQGPRFQLNISPPFGKGGGEGL
jgi:hypothetical protein